MQLTYAGLTFEVRDEGDDTIAAIIDGDEYGVAGDNFNGKLVFDIGAHVGAFSILAASWGARVIAVEPVPENVELLRLNAKGYGITVVEAALGCNRIRYGQVGDQWTYIANTGACWEQPMTLEAVPVTEVSFCDLAQVFGDPDIVKIDCEGGEWPALEEMLDVPLIVGEWHYFDSQGKRGYGAGDVDRLLPHHRITHRPIGSGEHHGMFRAER